MSETSWLRTSLGILTALCMVGSAACGSDSSPSNEPDETSEQGDDEKENKGEGDDAGDDTTVGDGPTVGRNVRGLPEGKNYIADNGFRPEKHGFLFPNGDRDDRGRRIQFPMSSPGHLDKDGMRRLFGDEQVCLGLEEHDGECLLSPGAHEFMNMVNRKMNGGQCEGLAVFALSLYAGKDPVDVFKEGATFASELDQNLIRGPVGYYFSYQFLYPFRRFLFQSMSETTPNEVLDTVIASLEQRDDPVALEFFQRGVGGHAVAPYAVEDKGNGIFHVRIWDNNFPRASRYIEFDKNKNSWLYSFGAINPREATRPWGGGASPNTIVATPVSKRMDKPAICPFCERKTGIRMVMTAGGVNALVRDSQGRKIGMENGKIVNEIPGASAYPVMSFVPGEPPPEPLYELPDDDDYDIELSGNGEVGTVGVFGTDHAMVMEDINIDKGSKDKVALSRDGKGLDYTPGAEGRKPKVRLAMGTGADSYRIEIDDLKPKKGRKLGFRVNRQLKSLAVTDGDQETNDFKGRVTRFTRKGQKHTVKLATKGKRGRRVNFGKLTAKLPAAKPRPRIQRPKKGKVYGRRPGLAPRGPNKPQPQKPVVRPRKPVKRAPPPKRPAPRRPPPKRRPIIRRK